MKKWFLNYSIGLIKKYRSDIDETHLEEIKYGLESIYLNVSKSIVVFTLAIIFGIFLEMILLLIFFNILRSTGFGLHATKSWACLLSSCLLFLILPFISKLFILPMFVKLILGVIAILLIYKYAPADTSKRPLISYPFRYQLKFKTTIKCIILVFLMVFINNQIISNLIIFGIYIEIFLILPFSYKLFNFSYNNYLSYNMS